MSKERYMINGHIEVLQSLQKHFEEKASPRMKFAAIRIALMAAIEALKKQIPEKPEVLANDHDVRVGAVKFVRGTKTYKCKKCNMFMSRTHKHCATCGQRVDWSET